MQYRVLYLFDIYHIFKNLKYLRYLVSNGINCALLGNLNLWTDVLDLPLNSGIQTAVSWFGNVC